MIGMIAKPSLEHITIKNFNFKTVLFPCSIDETCLDTQLEEQ